MKSTVSPMALLLMMALALLTLAHAVVALEEEPRKARDAAITTQGKDNKSRWFWGIAASNYHPRLAESEAMIDSQINALFGVILPRWEAPETFKDWSGDFKIWDLWVLVGRDVTEKTAWFAGVGGSSATIRNNETYFPLGIPLDVQVDFSRAEAFVAGGFAYYPWGKPIVDETAKRYNILKRALSGFRPYVEMGTGYTYIRAVGDVKVSTPLARPVFRQRQDDDYHLFQVSPRVGGEFPLTKKDSVSAVACYYFFTTHENEFNSAAFSVIYKHKFRTRDLQLSRTHPRTMKENREGKGEQ